MKCQKCSGSMVASEATFKREIAGVPFAITVPARKCSKCGSVVVSSEDAAAGELAIASHLAKRGPISGATFSYMRRILGLSGVDVGRLLDIGPQTISRWENDGTRKPDRSAWFTLGSMVLDAAAGRASTRARLGVLAEGPTPGPVHVHGHRPAATIARVLELLSGPHMTDLEIASRLEINSERLRETFKELLKKRLVIHEDGTELGDNWVATVPGGFDALLEAALGKGVDVDAVIEPASKPVKRAQRARA